MVFPYDNPMAILILPTGISGISQSTPGQLLHLWTEILPTSATWHILHQSESNARPMEVLAMTGLRW